MITGTVDFILPTFTIRTSFNYVVNVKSDKNYLREYTSEECILLIVFI